MIRRLRIACLVGLTLGIAGGVPGTALAHVGVDDGHVSGGLGVSFMLGAVVAMGLLLYLAYTQQEEEAEERAREERLQQ